MDELPHWDGSNCIVVIVSGVVALICSMFAVMVLLGSFCVRRVGWVSLKPFRRGDHRPRATALWTWLLMIALPTFITLICSHDITDGYLIAMQSALFFVVTVFMVLASFCDPGTIRAGAVSPSRASRCRTTNRLIYKHDHYCPFLGNTVGGGNYHFYWGFVVFTSVYGGFLCAMSVLCLLRHRRQELNAAGICEILLFLYTLAGTVLLGSLVSYHAFLTSINQTTSERRRLKKYSCKHQNPRALGITLTSNISKAPAHPASARLQNLTASMQVC